MKKSIPLPPEEPLPGDKETVNSPNHYAPNGVDSFMHMKDQIGKVAFAGFLQGNVIKYVQRHEFKLKPLEDLCKASFYLFHLALEKASERGAVQDVVQKLYSTLCHAAAHYGYEPKVVQK